MANLRERVTKNSFWTIIFTIINRMGVIALAIILPRLLGTVDYGLYSITFSVGMVIYTFADLGINQTTVKYISTSLARRKSHLSAYYSSLLKIKFFLALGVAIIMLAISYPLAIFVFKNQALLLPFLITSAYIFTYSIDGFYTHLFFPLEKVNYLSLGEILSQFLTITLSLLAILVLANAYKVAGVFIAMTISSLVIIIYYRYFLRRLSPQMFEKPKIKINTKRLLKLVGFLTIATISSTFFSYVDSIMLGLFLGQSPQFVGFYKAAYTIIGGIYGFLLTPTFIFLPIFSNARKSELSKLLNKSLIYFAFLAIPASFGILALGKYSILVFFGRSYLSATLPLNFLSFLIFPTIAISLFSFLFIARGKPKILAGLVLIALVINIVLNFILIKSLLLISPLWATAGAAIAILVSWLVYFIMSLILIKREFNISITFRPLLKSVIASLIMFGALFYINLNMADMTLLKGLFEIVLGVVIYIVLMFLFRAIKRSDISLIKLMFKR